MSPVSIKHTITIYTTTDFIQSGHYYTGCALLYRMCSTRIMQGVHYYTGRALLHRGALLYRVCIIIEVHYYTGCALYRMCIIIQGVHYYTGCIIIQGVHYYTECALLYRGALLHRIALLYRVSIIIQNVHYYATRCFISSRLNFSPIEANVRILFDTYVSLYRMFGSWHLHIKWEGMRKEAVAAYCKLLSEQLHRGSEVKPETISQYSQNSGPDSISDFSNTDQRCQPFNLKCN
jgi:hypothetical protein